MKNPSLTKDSARPGRALTAGAPIMLKTDSVMSINSASVRVPGVCRSMDRAAAPAVNRRIFPRFILSLDSRIRLEFIKILTHSPTLLATNPRSASPVETDYPAFGSRGISTRQRLSGSTRFRFQLLTYRYTPLRDALKLFVCWRLVCSPWHPCTSSV